MFIKVGTQLPILITQGGKVMSINAMVGLMPGWVTKGKVRQYENKRQKEARSESILEKPFFRDACQRKQRCVVPMAFFKERHHYGKNTIHVVTNKSGAELKIAGIYEFNDFDSVFNKYGFANITAEANDVIKPVNHRMPAILDNEDQVKQWLSNEIETKDLVHLLDPYPSDLLTMALDEGQLEML